MAFKRADECLAVDSGGRLGQRTSNGKRQQA
jgi:hypothetical protein